jgi:hypothetical protein
MVFFYVLSRNYWEAQEAIWGSVFWDLTSNVNETCVHIYFRIYLFRVKHSGCVSLAEWAIEEEEKGNRRGGEGQPPRPP